MKTSTAANSFNLSAWMAPRQAALEDFLIAVFAEFKSADTDLYQAMRYSSLAGGKRIRPLLLFSVAEMLGTELESCLPGAAALEFIHCYSLVHDDLPVMDDDDLRRGRPSCHKKYGEASAILAGDNLQTFAFKTLVEAKLWPEVKVELIKVLATASEKMVLGQALDIASGATNINKLSQLHQNKTGALIQAALVLGAVVGGADRSEIDKFTKIGAELGLAFQIYDDILDVVGDSTTLGKPAGSDIDADKSTYVSLLGLEQAQNEADKHYQNLVRLINTLLYDSKALAALVHFIVNREY